MPTPRKWTYEIIQQEALKYARRSEFERGTSGAYKAAISPESKIKAGKQNHRKRRPHRGAPIPTNLREECRITALALRRTFVSQRNTFKSSNKKDTLLTG